MINGVFKKDEDKTKKSVQNFESKSKSFYSLCGGISDAFACEGGISVGSMCNGPEVNMIMDFGLVREIRLDLRGTNSYSLGSRHCISCWNISALNWSLNKLNYSVVLDVRENLF